MNCHMCGKDHGPEGANHPAGKCVHCGAKILPGGFICQNCSA